MPRYVALLRGINLGGHTVKMVHLAGLFEKLGFKNVETFIASGNVIFESPSKDIAALEKKIETHLEKSLGFPALTFLWTDAELAQVAEHPLYESSAEHPVYIGFLKTKPSAASKAKLLTYQSKHDEFHVTEREAYWLCRKKGMSESDFFRVGLDKALGMPVTVRNTTTIRKLVAKYPARRG